MLTRCVAATEIVEELSMSALPSPSARPSNHQGLMVWWTFLVLHSIVDPAPIATDGSIVGSSAKAQTWVAVKSSAVKHTVRYSNNTIA